MSSTKTILLIILLLGIGIGLYIWSASGQRIDDGQGMMKDDSMMMEEKEGNSMMERNDDSMMEAEGEVMMGKDDAMMMKKDDSMMEDESTNSMMKSSGAYEPYDENKLAFADGGDVVLFFRASWCPTCRGLDANIKANATAIPHDLLILDVDYDNSTALKQKYGVTYQHTLVQVDSEGNMITKWSGSPTLNELASMVK